MHYDLPVVFPEAREIRPGRLRTFDRLICRPFRGLHSTLHWGLSRMMYNLGDLGGTRCRGSPAQREMQEELSPMQLKIKNAEIQLIQGDITEMETDAIVNAANEQLVLGGGVAGAIRRKGGAQIQEECDLIGGSYVGGAVITTGGKLKAKHVIHAVGPRMGEGNEDEKLRNATLNSLKLADENGLTSIAFPAISTGIFGFPRERCAPIMLQTTKTYLEGSTKLQKVVFCLFDQETLNIFRRFAHKL